MFNEILKYSYKHNLGHIPSALSMVDYIEVLFNHITPQDDIVIGKPFGAQAYYCVWKKLHWLDDIDNLSMGVKHDEIPFIDYSEETIGNALGVASGMTMCSNKKTYVNITDAALQMGNTIEAIQFIGQHQQNVTCLVDFNNAQVSGATDEIISVRPIISMAKLYGWNIQMGDGHDKDWVRNVLLSTNNMNTPILIVCITEKGHGVPEMINEIKRWHYGKLTKNDLDRFMI